MRQGGKGHYHCLSVIYLSLSLELNPVRPTEAAREALAVPEAPALPCHHFFELVGAYFDKKAPRPEGRRALKKNLV